MISANCSNASSYANLSLPNIYGIWRAMLGHEWSDAMEVDALLNQSPSVPVHHLQPAAKAKAKGKRKGGEREEESMLGRVLLDVDGAEA